MPARTDGAPHAQSVSPLVIAADAARDAAEGSTDAADLAQGRRHPLARPGRVERLTPPVVVGHPLAGDDALERALTDLSAPEKAYGLGAELLDVLALVRDADPAYVPALNDDARVLLMRIAVTLGEIQGAQSASVPERARAHGGRA